MKDEYVDKTIEILGENLVTLAEYNTGDESYMLAVCKELDFSTLRNLRQLKEVPIVFTVEEINNARDVFPVQLLNIKRHHSLIIGKDILEDIEIASEDIRRQLEFEFRSKLLQLRQAYMASNAKKDKDLDGIILAAVPTMAPIMGALMFLKDIRGQFNATSFKDAYGIDVQILMDIYHIRKNSEVIGDDDRNTYIQRLITVLEQLGKIVDQMKIIPEECHR